MKSLFRLSGLKVGPKSLQKLKKPVTWLMLGLIMFVMTGLINITQVWAAVPPIPQNVTAEGISDSEIKVSWSDVSNEQGYRIFSSPTGSIYTQVGEVGPNIISYINTGLTEQTCYYYRVKSFNAEGESASSAPSLRICPKLIIPTDLCAIAMIDSVGLTWKDNSQKESGYVIEQSAEPNSGFSQVATTSANATTKTITGLSSGTTYYFRIKAVYLTSNESDYSNIAFAKTLKAPEWVGKTPSMNEPTHAAIYGNYVYYNGTDGISVLDISNINEPLIQKSTLLPAGVLTINDHYLYYCDETKLKILDIASPLNPVAKGSLDLASTCPFTMSVSGTKLFIANNTAGLTAIDVSNPSQPSILGSYSDGNAVYWAAVFGNTAVIIDGAGYLSAINVANPAAMTLIDKKASVASARLAINNGYVYVIEKPGYNTNLLTYRLPIQGDPTLVLKNTLNLNYLATNILVTNNKLYLDTYTYSKIYVYSLANPEAPSSLESADSYCNSPKNMVANNDTLVQVCLNPTTGPDSLNFTKLSDLTVTKFTSYNDASIVKAVGSRLYSASYGKLFVHDIIDPNNPIHIKSIDTGESAVRSIYIKDNYIYVGAGTKLLVYEMSSFSQKAALNFPALAQDIIAVGDILYVANNTAGIITVDIDDPLSPAILGNFDTYAAISLDVVNNIAYVADMSSIKIINVQDPANMSLIGELAMTTALKIKIKGHYAYVADGKMGVGGGLKTIDISNPASPVLIDTDQPSYTSYADLEIINGYLFLIKIGDGIASHGLVIYDLTNPTNPLEICYLNTLYPGTNIYGYPKKLSIAGNRAYVTNDKLGVQVADVSDFMPTELTVEKSADKTTTASGQEITYTLNVKNETASTMTNVVLRDPLPSGTSFVSASNDGQVVGGVVTWPTKASFAPNDSFTYTFKVRVE